MRQYETLSRVRWRIQGQVQGVGFRPFVYRLARRYRLSGFVRNGGDGVTLEVQGPDHDLDRFAVALRDERPPLAVIDHMTPEHLEPHPDDGAFEIVASHPGRADTHVTVDTALCDDCRRELLDANDRRHGYALINCTNCGPRYSIIRNVPYDRAHTTMTGFAMCPACRREYADPTDRRFHAQPIACHDCGPRLALTDAWGCPLAGEPIRQAAALLDAGRILAIKGLGGFHLAVRADQRAAVERLRQRKRRDAKPFAVMVRDLAEARGLGHLSPQAEALMQSPRCPIVLAPRRAGLSVCEAVAPGSHRLGLMLPYTPIHHLLFACTGPRLGPLVMTSGNVSDEPLVIDNAEAYARLGDLCDAVLLHNRPIERPVDDSVYLDTGDSEPLPLRRARGDAPSAMVLPALDGTGEMGSAGDGLCVGGELKNTVAVVRGGEVILSPHIGDLKHPLAYQAFKRAIEDLLRLFEVHPRWIAADLHPAYLSTRHASDLAAAWRVPLWGVQHHHAHAAALLCEHGRTGPILSLAFDGVGYGETGDIRGGELLATDLDGYQRLAHLRPLRLAGGDAAARDTRRSALALLHQALGDHFHEHPAVRRLYPTADEQRMLCEMIRHRVNCVDSTALGRVFDGAAALLGVCERNAYEAQAPMLLEAAAAVWTGDTCLRLDGLYHRGCGVVDLSPLVGMLLSDTPAPQRAAMFHVYVADAWVEAVLDARQRTGLNTVGLTGGVVNNQLLTHRLTHRLQAAGFTVLRHRRVPAGDGGLALGQAAIAAARLARERSA